MYILICILTCSLFNIKYNITVLQISASLLANANVKSVGREQIIDHSNV